MNLCRACLCSNTELFTFDDDFVSNYNLLTNLNVAPRDGKSQQFCHACMETVNYFIEFRNKCTSTELALQDICSNQVVKLEKLGHDDKMVVKGEVKQEYNDFIFEPEFDGEPEFEEEPEFEQKCEIKTESNCDLPKQKPKRRLRTKKPIINKVKVEKRPNPCLDIKYKQVVSKNPACGLCGKVFDDKGALNKHLEEHKSHLSCQLCPGTRFEHWPQCLSHRMVHLPGAQHCHLCDQKFKTPAHLEYHYWKVHCGVNDVRLKCSFCPGAFSTPRKLSKHVWRQHSKNKYICDICSKEYHNKQTLKIHIAAHSAVPRFVCDLCGFRCKFVSGLAAHTIRRHTPEKCICKICERPFANAAKMAKHNCSDVSKICPICGKKLRKGMARHLRMHEPGPKYACTRCPAAYRSRTALKVHNDKHDNNPTQRCEVCDARFYSPSVLIKHRRVHTGEKPYACTKCSMRFTGGNNLKVHMKVHGEMLIVKKTEEAATIFGVTKIE